MAYLTLQRDAGPIARAIYCGRFLRARSFSANPVGEQETPARSSILVARRLARLCAKASKFYEDLLMQNGSCLICRVFYTLAAHRLTFHYIFPTRRETLLKRHYSCDARFTGVGVSQPDRETISFRPKRKRGNIVSLGARVFFLSFAPR